MSSSIAFNSVGSWLIMAFLAKLKTCSGKESTDCFHSCTCFGSTVSLTTLAITPWDLRPRKWSKDPLALVSLRMVEAFLRSRFSNSESTRMFGPFEASQSFLMLGFLLDCKICRLVKLILAALCANVGIPSPQKPVGELAHSVTYEIGRASCRERV